MINFIALQSTLTIKKIINDLTGLIFPEICCSCGGRLTQHEESICLDCLYNLPKTFFHQIPNNPVSKRMNGRIEFENATALYFFAKSGRVQKLIHQLKYKGKYDIGIKLGEQLGKTLRKENNWLNIDAIVPIPLHPKRLKQRGYNQAEAIAEGLSITMDLPIAKDLVMRKVNNTSQTKKKDNASRWKNVKDIFKVNDPNARNQHFLLVDDVITTGSTMEACAIAIKKQIPSASFSFATVACADIF